MTESSPRRVVIANGSRDVQERFASILKDAGHQTVSLTNSSQLFEHLTSSASPVHLLLLDLRMLDSTGHDRVQSILKLNDGRFPILIFSGSISSANEIEHLTKLGVRGFLNEHSANHQILPSLAPYLFPNNFDRRTSLRIELGIPVTYRFDNNIATTRMLNLSRGGLAVRTINPLPIGTKVQVQFRLPSVENDLQISARVVWSNVQMGMGIQFEQADFPEQSALDAFVDRQVNPDRST